MRFPEYLRAKAVSLWMAGIAGLYLVLVSYLCALPISLTLLILFKQFKNSKAFEYLLLKKSLIEWV